MFLLLLQDCANQNTCVCCMTRVSYRNQKDLDRADNLGMVQIIRGGAGKRRRHKWQNHFQRTRPCFGRQELVFISHNLQNISRETTQEIINIIHCTLWKMCQKLSQFQGLFIRKHVPDSLLVLCLRYDFENAFKVQNSCQ